LNRRELAEALERRPGTIENTVTGVNHKLQLDHLSDLWHELVFDLGIALGKASSFPSGDEPRD